MLGPWVALLVIMQIVGIRMLTFPDRPRVEHPCGIHGVALQDVRSLDVFASLGRTSTLVM